MSRLTKRHYSTDGTLRDSKGKFDYVSDSSTTKVTNKLGMMEDSEDELIKSYGVGFNLAVCKLNEFRRDMSRLADYYEKDKHNKNRKFKVYVIHPVKSYNGLSLIAADSSDDANKIISDFMESDDDNTFSSEGYDFVTERDAIKGTFSSMRGIIHSGIYRQ